jgi:membrane protease YdiL (CAAX protease family)
MLIATDPWLVDGDHWYFNQPLRLGLEAVFAFAAGAVLWCAGAGRLLFHRVGRTHVVPLLIWGGLIAALFTFARSEVWLPLTAPAVIGAAALWFATGIFIGIGQELTFRGLLFTGLDAYLNRPWTWVLSIFIFVVAPLHSYRVVIYAMDGREGRALFLCVVYLLAGIFFTWLRTRTQSLLVPGIIHALVNALTFSATFTLVALGGEAA